MTAIPCFIKNNVCCVLSGAEEKETLLFDTECILFPQAAGCASARGGMIGFMEE